jgi:hypothetical protein
MKSWLAKFKTSIALDRPEHSKAQSAMFADDIHAVHHALSQRPPTSDAPTDLTFAIMNEVRTSHCADHRVRDSNRKLVLRWLPAPVISIGVLMGTLWLIHRQPATPVQQPAVNQASILAIGPALDLGVEAARATPPVVVGPLTDELARVNSDLNKAGEFLLGSLP